MIHVLFTYLTSENNDEFFANTHHNFSQNFNEKVSKYKRWQDAKSTVLGRLLLGYGLKHFYKQDIENLKMNFSKDKKPFLEDSSIHFNISHSKELIVCAISSAGTIGIDVEKISDLNIEDFTEQFSENEIGSMHNSSNTLKSFYNHWTQKEAIVKANGSGLHIPLNSFEINNHQATIADECYYLKEIPLNPQYICNVATQNIISDNVMTLTSLNSELITGFGSCNNFKSFC
ncbi:4'-phosphopantetheinyl transferase family protein [Maribacter aquivivus]|uniref:4'-phosphopantetheinyl transferase family protein n=1 Tax=Maribacter aquivivus TaxID=228958 RepID=UPI00249382BC|nr:4'-phosphopantetheinyl transferase superfamily protein [Maribacter aquivivus]